MDRGINDAKVNNTGDYLAALLKNSGMNSTSYAIFLQFIIVTYLFLRVGHGWFWRVLLIMAAAGCLADLIQTSFTILFQLGIREWPRAFLVAAEPFWIINEFGVVFLNFLKINTLISKRSSLYMKIVLSILFLSFTGTRIVIGIRRYEKMIVSDFGGEIDSAHIPAFVILSVAQLICSTTIIIVVRHGIISETQKLNFLRGLEKYLMRSSLFMLLLVDLVSVMLLITLAVNIKEVKDAIIPLLTTKSVAALIIAVDNIAVRVLIASEEETRTRQLLLQSQTNCQSVLSINSVNSKSSDNREILSIYPLSPVESKRSLEKIKDNVSSNESTDTNSCESISWDVSDKVNTDLLPMNYTVQDTPPSENGDFFRNVDQ